MDNPHTPVKRRGCLRWACGGCLGVILLTVAVAAFAWWRLTRWDRGDSAWEHLPPSTVLAFELHDLRGLLTLALDSPPLARLIGMYAGEFERQLLSLQGEDYVPSENDLDLVELYRTFGFLHTTFAPNLATLGLTATDELFIIVKLPALARWSLPAVDAGAIGYWGDGIYFAHVDGWTVFAGTDSTLRVVLDGWNAGALPVGPRHRGTGPSIRFATRPARSQAAPAASQPDAPLMLGNPFAAQTAPESTGSAVRLLIQPVNGSWQVDGAAAVDIGADAADAFLADHSVPPSPRPSLTIPRGDHAIALTAHVPAERLRALAETLGGTAAALSPLIEGLQGTVAATMDAPTVDDPYLLPMPLVTVGLALQTEASARQAATFLTERTDALDTEPTADQPLSQVMAQIVRVESIDTADAVGRVVYLPPELANTANPSWLVEPSAQPPLLWVSSDPSGLEGREDANASLAAPHADGMEKGMQASVRWAMTQEFSEGLYDLVLDRLGMIPDESLPSKVAVLQAATIASMIFHVFPHGEAQCTADASTRVFTLSATVQPGTE